MSWLRRLLFLDRGPREGDILAPESVATTESEAVELARRAAVDARLTWHVPVRAYVIFHAGRPCWFVNTNAHARGFRVTVVVDATSRDVLAIDQQLR